MKRRRLSLIAAVAASLGGAFESRYPNLIGKNGTGELKRQRSPATAELLQFYADGKRQRKAMKLSGDAFRLDAGYYRAQHDPRHRFAMQA